MRHPGFEMGFGELWRSRERRVEINKRLDGPVESAARMTAIGQDLRMAGQQRERVVIALNRLARPVQSQQRVTPIDEGADMGRLVRQHTLITCHRLDNTAKLEVDVAEIEEDLRMIRGKLQRMAEAGDRLLVASA